MEEQSRQAELMLYQPSMAPVRIPLATEVVSLGRAVDCTIPIKDRFLSRRHAEIIFRHGDYFLRDCNSANGTLINGVRLENERKLEPGDHITLGDTEIVFDSKTGQVKQASVDSISVDDSILSSNLSIPVHRVVEEDLAKDRHPERLQILNALAMELLEDRPLNELFDFILDRVMKLLKPSRAALALLNEDKKSFTNVKLRRTDESDTSGLTISRTLLNEVVEGKKVLSYVDMNENEKISQALSIIGQSIRSVLCAPLIVGDSVLGVLYVDYLVTKSRISEEEVRLVAQVARFAAIKLETTRLREESYAKQKMDEELRTAYVIQSRLLPSAPPEVEGFYFAGLNRPCRTVSGDYFDFVARPDGRVYFVIADVSGKGITAALVMASLATAFNIFTRDDPDPAALVRELNQTLAPKTAPTKFVTLFAAVLDPTTGTIEFTNAGHCPPLIVRKDSVEQLRDTDMVIGLFPPAVYRTQRVTLEPGDALITFTDGIIEAENSDEIEMGSDPITEIVRPFHGVPAEAAVRAIEAAVLEYMGNAAAGDDITILGLSRHAG
ncbi:MAG TPA: SpoIIE family protein phosphatase [Thermoanaerobaculia bacterium]|nr:SpoIIE family protein phosphatase [Thermoanaerobaculia bacterium]